MNYDFGLFVGVVIHGQKYFIAKAMFDLDLIYFLVHPEFFTNLSNFGRIGTYEEMKFLLRNEAEFFQEFPNGQSLQNWLGT